VTRRDRIGWAVCLPLAAILALPLVAGATSIGITVSRGTTVALPAHGLVPVKVYTNEGRTAAGILHPDGTVTWVTVVVPGPEAAERVITSWTRKALPDGDVLLTDGAVLPAVTRQQWAGEVR
jgi:hypothetical protein